MAFLKSTSELSKIEWGRSYLWDVSFMGAPAPFNDWFPAQSYEEVSATGQSLVLPWYISQYKFPQNTANIDINMTVYDDVKGTLFEWMNSWYKEIYDTSQGVVCLDEAVRVLRVAKLNLDRTPLKTTTYYVYPEGVLSFHGDSQSDVKQYQLTFVVAGKQE